MGKFRSFPSLSEVFVSFYFANINISFMFYVEIVLVRSWEINCLKTKVVVLKSTCDNIFQTHKCKYLVLNSIACSKWPAFFTRPRIYYALWFLDEKFEINRQWKHALLRQLDPKQKPSWGEAQMMWTEYTLKLMLADKQSLCKIIIMI